MQSESLIVHGRVAEITLFRKIAMGNVSILFSHSFSPWSHRPEESLFDRIGSHLKIIDKRT